MKNYIQIGTNNGRDYFNRKCQELTERSRIILIEPIKEHNNQIEKAYEDISAKNDVVIVNKAIVPNETVKNIDLYCLGLDKALSSVIKRKTICEIPSSDIINVESITINSLLIELGINDVEELHIDAEGLDYEILLSIDTKRINIRLITCEIWPHEDDDSNNVYKTGPSMIPSLNEMYSDYTIEEIRIDGMPSLKFVKK